MALELAPTGERAAASRGGSAALAPAALLAVLGALLWLPLAPTLLGSWRGEDTMAHGPLVPLVTAGLLWAQRRHLRHWEGGSRGGFALLMACCFLHVLAAWADVAFIAGITLVGMLIAAAWYLGGRRLLKRVAGPLGFLAFMLPWPTSVVDRISFPLQMTSSSYAALLSGLLGLPVHREGVHLSIRPDLDADPIYRVMVARQCSGLTSLIVLLALGYLIAYATPVRLGWKALLVAAVVPLALFTNALRLTLILMAGAHHGEALAAWVHDNEAPVLISLCCVILLALRSGVLAWSARRPGEKAVAS